MSKYGLISACICLCLSCVCDAQSLAGRVDANHRVYLPTGEGPFATIVAIPGCSGVSFDSPATDAGRPGDEGDRLFRRHYARVSERLSGQGYAVVIVDYLSAEGVANTCGGEISYERVGEYVGAAVEFALDLSTTDRERVFVIGWSHGGAGLIAWLEALGTDQPRVAGAIAVYPACNSLDAWVSATPVLVLLGGADDIALPDECWRIARRLPDSTGASFHEYPEGRHGFDWTEGPEMLEIGGGMTLGRSREAGEAAWSEILRFLDAGS